MRAYSCKECGQPYVANRRKKSSLCDDCGMIASREAIIGMLSKEGPYYERWKAATRKAKDEGKARQGSIRPER